MLWYSVFAFIHWFVGSSHTAMCSFKHKNFAILTWKPLCWSLFLIKCYVKKTPTQVFSCEHCKIFKNTYFEEHLPVAVSVWRHQNPSEYLFLGIWMFLPNLFEPEYILYLASSKWVFFIKKKVFHYVFIFQVLFKIGVLESFAQNRCSWKSRKFHRKTLKSDSLFNKVAGLKRLPNRCFPVKFAKFLTTPFLRYTSIDYLGISIDFISSMRLSDSTWRSSQVIK